MAEKQKVAKSIDDRRLWIGNLDPRVNEYQLLKLTEKFGKIEKFDLLYHRSGPQANKPRGYAFVTYEKPENALEAKIHLDRKLVGAKHICVTWAHCMPLQEPEKKEVEIPALALATKKQDISREKQIQAIEAKLNMMSSNSADLIINKTVTTEPPVIQLKPPEDKSGPHKHGRHRSNYVPYNRGKRKY